MRAALRGGGDAEVPCGSCTACCTSSQFVPIGADETDTFNLIVRPHVYAAHRLAARAGALLVRGKVERQGDVIHIMTHRITDLSDKLAELRAPSRNFR